MSDSLPRRYHLPLSAPPLPEGFSFHEVHPRRRIEDFSGEFPVFDIDRNEVRRMFGVKCAQPANTKNVICDDAILALHKWFSWTKFFVVRLACISQCGVFLDGFVSIERVTSDLQTAFSDARRFRATDLEFGCVDYQYEVWRVCNSNYFDTIRGWNGVVKLSKMPLSEVAKCSGCGCVGERDNFYWAVDVDDKLDSICFDCGEEYFTDNEGELCDRRCACCGKTFPWYKLFSLPVLGIDADFCLKCFVLRASHPDYDFDMVCSVPDFLPTSNPFSEYSEDERKDALLLAESLETLRQLREAGRLAGMED